MDRTILGVVIHTLWQLLARKMTANWAMPLMVEDSGGLSDEELDAIIATLPPQLMASDIRPSSVMVATVVACFFDWLEGQPIGFTARMTIKLARQATLVHLDDLTKMVLKKLERPSA